MKFDRYYTRAITRKSTPWDTAQVSTLFKWKKFEVLIKEGDRVVLKDDVLAPEDWAQNAVTILAHKYLRKAGVPTATMHVEPLDQPNAMTMPRWLWPSKPTLQASKEVARSERSAAEVFHRLAGHWTYAAWTENYFYDANVGQQVEAYAQAFYDETFYALASQMAAPNSPQWFNTGLWWAYGIEGSTSPDQCGYRSDKIGQARAALTTNTYQHPQVSACFILGMRDSLLGSAGIIDTIAREARIFKFGSGSGVNYSTLRAKGSALSNGGTSSGLMSFLRLFDANAGTIKSGGTTRRAARMAIVDTSHPEAKAFALWKANEETKVSAMVDGAKAALKAGTSRPAHTTAALTALASTSYEGEAYSTVSGQNANNSLRATDNFMNTIALGTIAPVSNKVHDERHDLWNSACRAAWECGDPGFQFHDTINAWHTIPKVAPQYATNPCQPGFATVLTPKGIRTFDDINVGDEVWTGKRYSKIRRKVSTGIKSVYEYRTSAGIFVGTANHRILQNGVRVEVGDAESIDICSGPANSDGYRHNEAVVDGLMLGDGSVIRANGGANTYFVLNIGAKDGDYLKDPSIASLLAAAPYDQKGDYHSRHAETSISESELGKLWERRVPSRYRYADSTVVAAFLRGLFSANGCVTAQNKRVQLKTTSPQLRDDVMMMLSSIGIPSYYTTNGPARILHANGEYTSRESFDINITRGRQAFRDQIGFLQLYKQQALAAGLENYKEGSNTKNTYEIISADWIGQLPVYDIEVEADEHTYWTGGMLVSNCSEYSFIDNSSCNLASLNLLKFWKDGSHLPSSDENPNSSYFDATGYTFMCWLWTTILDISVGMGSYPDAEVAQNSVDYRAIGLGYANLGGLLMTAGIPYDSDEGRAIGGLLTATMHGCAWQQSSIMASELGGFRDYASHAEDVRRVLERHRSGARSLIESAASKRIHVVGHGHPFADILEWVELNWLNAVPSTLEGAYPIRNAQLTLLAPTGTIGMVMGCDSTGIEPVYALTAWKQLAGGGGMTLEVGLLGSALRALGYGAYEVTALLEHVRRIGAFGLAAPHIRREHLPVFDCANDIGVDGHLGMMAAVQPFLSGAISKTVNLPNSATIEDVSATYLKAWKLGLKAIALYRDGCKQSQPLSVAAPASASAGAPTVPKATVTPNQSPRVTPEGVPVVLGHPPKGGLAPRYKLPSRRGGWTQKVEISGYSLYLRTGEFEDGRLGEVFLNISRDGSTINHFATALAITISLGLQHGVPLKEYLDAFSDSRSEPSGLVVGSDNVRLCTSIMDYVVRELWAHYGDKETFISVVVQSPEPENSVPAVTVVMPTGGLVRDQAFKDLPVSTLPPQLTLVTPVGTGSSSAEGVTGLRTLSSATAMSAATTKYSGSACASCGSFKMRRSGTCHTCENCGTTSGCS